MYLPEVISPSNLKETYFVQEVTRSRRSSILVSYRCCLCLADLVTMHTAFVIIRFLIDREVLPNKQWCLVYIHELRFTAWTINEPHLPYKTGLDVMQSHPLHARLGGNCMCHTNRGTSVCCIHDKAQQVYLHILGFIYESTIGTFDWCQLLFSTNNLFYHSNKIRTSYSVAAVLHVEIFKDTCLYNCWKTHITLNRWPCLIASCYS